MGEGAWWQEEKSQDQSASTRKSVTEEICLEKHNNTFLKAYPPRKWRETTADLSPTAERITTGTERRARVSALL